MKTSYPPGPQRMPQLEELSSLMVFPHEDHSCKVKQVTVGIVPTMGPVHVAVQHPRAQPYEQSHGRPRAAWVHLCQRLHPGRRRVSVVRRSPTERRFAWAQPQLARTSAGPAGSHAKDSQRRTQEQRSGLQMMAGSLLEGRPEDTSLRPTQKFGYQDHSSIRRQRRQAETFRTL